MKKYKICVPISGYVIYHFEAKDEFEAKSIVSNNTADYDYFNIERISDPNSWTVERVKEDS